MAWLSCASSGASHSSNRLGPHVGLDHQHLLGVGLQHYVACYLCLGFRLALHYTETELLAGLRGTQHGRGIGMRTPGYSMFRGLSHDFYTEALEALRDSGVRSIAPSILGPQGAYLSQPCSLLSL